MLLEKIKDHNYLNGFKFVIVEFGFFILVILPFTAFYLLHKNVLYGLVGLGLISNFVFIIFFACKSILRKEKSLGIRQVYSRKMREEIGRKFPNLSKDSFILFFTLLIPFLLSVLVTLELINSNKDPKSNKLL